MSSPRPAAHRTGALPLFFWQVLRPRSEYPDAPGLPSGFSYPMSSHAFAATLALHVLVSPAFAESRPTPPDIILILADDLGFSDLSGQGGEIATPHIDRLANEGARFTAASTAARCCPSRASLLTGAYAHRVGLGWMTETDLGRPAYRGELAPDCATLPEVLNTAGYRSFMAGKWHLSAKRDIQGPPAKDSWPTRRGFERFFGVLAGATSYTAPALLLNGETPVPTGPGFNLTDAISDEAVKFIETPSPAPRFLYVAYTAPHWPLHAAPEAVERHLAAYADGYEPVARARLARLRELGLLAPGQSVAPGAWEDWAALSPALRADQTRRMAIYAAQLQDMDRGVGRILDAVARGGRERDTLILFASDNGACAEVLEAPPLPVELSDSVLSSYGSSWAAVGSLPFRGHKAQPLEGGLATPLFVRWPARIAAGQRVAEPVHLIDVLPSIAEAVGVELPRSRNDRPLIVPDGRSFLPALSGLSLPARDLFFEHEGGRAVRRGSFKAVSPRHSGTWCLYDLASDPAELRDLATEDPDTLRSLTGSWTVWATLHGVIPLDPRDWNERTRTPAAGPSAR